MKVSDYHAEVLGGFATTLDDLLREIHQMKMVLYRQYGYVDFVKTLDKIEDKVNSTVYLWERLDDEIK
jgi:hypothetical protein